MTKRRTVEDRRDLSRGMLAAYQAAIDFVDREPNDAVAAFNRRMGVAEGLLTGHWDALDYNLSLDWGLIADLQKQFFWAQAVGYDNAGGPLRILDLIEPGPLRDIRPDAVGIPGTDTQDRTP